MVLDCFGDEFSKFSISRYIWIKIFDASEDVVKHYPYAPYIMHIIEHVLGIHFPIDNPHKKLRLSNMLSLHVLLHRVLCTLAMLIVRSLSPPPLVVSPPASSSSS